MCKQRPETYVRKIISELSKREVRARIENDYQDLLKEPIVEILNAFFRLTIDIKSPNDWETLLQAMSDLWGIDYHTDNDNYYSMQVEDMVVSTKTPD